MKPISSPPKTDFQFKPNVSLTTDSELTNGASTDDKEEARNTYLRKLRSLNEGVSAWIKQHVDKNAYCILTPIFKDYEKYFAEIEKEDPDRENKSEENVKISEVEPTTLKTGLLYVPL